MTVKTVSAAQFAEAYRNSRIDLIDVRTPAEFRELHVKRARNVPLDRLDVPALLKPSSAGKPVYFICRTGSRGRMACEKFLEAGGTHAVNVEGGTLACAEVGLPIERGRKAVSLERQVRIAAGSLVLFGVLLGWLVHPGLLGLSAFVGCGLIFAGITDTCGMGMLLARMPWNNVNDAAPSCATKQGSS